jgi:PPOX class probable F420-dependent enzyme
VLPVTYAVCGELLVSAVDHKRKQLAGDRLARVRWLRARPAAALTVDQYNEDWSELAWVQAVGNVEVLAVADAPLAIAALVERYEQYVAHAPAGPVLALHPDRLLWWRAAG